MGIPKFFRFISERWPLITQEIDSPEMVVFDNLYLDMNSILHNCSHPNEGLSHLTEDQIFSAVFAYIDHLFNLIKPQQVFYMAIDGVAPRAKMNQQRSRRFRTAVEAEQAMEKAIENGDVVPKEPAFDTNSITPGTEFMAKVTENLKFYINQKVSIDSNWKNIKVILSGHEVPGEGEHKIMDYIRVQKSQPGYNPNTRHCVYGLDADLIMLGLVAHEPHFSLLREEVTFGRKSKQSSSDLTQQTFFLLHISLVRDYLQQEFKELADDLSFEYDFERVLDDFILIMYVIGNDFLPNLPDLHLTQGAFPLLIETFKETMRRTDGYLNNYGTINYQRLRIWLELLSHFELENFEAGAVDVEWFNKQLDNVSRRGEQKRARQGRELLIKQQKSMVSHISSWLLNLYRSDFSIKEFYEDDSKIPSLSLDPAFFENQTNVEFIKQFGFEVGVLIIHSKSKNTWRAVLDIDGIDMNESKEDYGDRFNDLKLILKKWQNSVIVEDETALQDEKNLYDEKFIKWKDNYYKEKLHFSIQDEDKLTSLAENYLEGLQWVLYYYYKGVCSWPWYFRYHYAPRISDVIKGIDVKIDFKLGKPFTPFEQLMSVLPARSRKLLPAVYGPLMTDENSPIIDFYPADCDVDKNGKTASWEAVVLLSFVDEKRLLEAMKPLESKLSPEEAKRNSFGTDLIYTFNPQVTQIIKSPIPAAFPDFESHTIESVYHLPSMDGLEYIIGLAEGVHTGSKLLAGFPTLQTLPFVANLRHAKLTVFQQPSRSNSMILSIFNQYEGLTIEQFSQQYVGEVVYAQWPYLREYKVEFVMDDLMKYEKLKADKGKKIISKSPLENFEISEFNSIKKDYEFIMHHKKGVTFEDSNSEDEILEQEEFSYKKQFEKKEPIEGLVFARKVVGLAPTDNGHLKKIFSDKIEAFPIQLIVSSIPNADTRFKEVKLPSIDIEYPKGTDVMFLGLQSYGGHGKVLNYFDEKSLIIDLERQNADAEPNYGIEAANREKAALRYHSSQDAARILRVHPRFFSKFTSMMMVTTPSGEKKNVGLNLKSIKKGLKTLGYCRTNGRYWEFSDVAINFAREYRTKFPEIFKALSVYQGNDIPEITSLLPDRSSEWVKQNLKDLRKWLSEREASMVQVTLSSEALSRQSIDAIEKQIIHYSIAKQPVVSKQMKCPRYSLLNPSKGNFNLKKQKFNLGDRVVYAIDSGKVPAFSKGTVIGFRSFPANVSVQVLFDYPVLTGNTFDGRLSTQRGLSVDSSALLNITSKQMVVKSKNKKGTKTDNASKKAQTKTPIKQEVKKEKNNSNKNINTKIETANPVIKKTQSKKILETLKSDDVETQDSEKNEKQDFKQEYALPTQNHAAQKILNQLLGGPKKSSTGNVPSSLSQPVALEISGQLPSKNEPANAYFASNSETLKSDSCEKPKSNTADSQKLLNMLQKKE